jgi:hypothetical protein
LAAIPVASKPSASTASSAASMSPTIPPSASVDVPCSAVLPAAIAAGTIAVGQLAGLFVP